MMFYNNFVFVFVWCPCMAINVSVQYNGGFLPGIMLTQCYYHRGTRLNAMKPMIPPRRFDIFFPLTEGCSEGLRRCIQIFLSTLSGIGLEV